MSVFQRRSAWILLGLIGSSVLTPATVAQPAECSSANIVLSTQAEVDAFQANYGSGSICSVVTGGLTIQGSDITNLDGLGEITIVESSLSILRNDTLTNLDGLSRVSSVGGDVHVRNNAALANLDGLGGIARVGGNVGISSNETLTNVDGLSRISSVGDNLSISANTALTNLDGLSAITSVGEHLSVSDNDALTNLDGLSRITSVGGDVTVTQNDTLTNVDGLSGIINVPKNLTISRNSALINLDGLSRIIRVGETLQVFANDALTNLDGLTKISSVGEDLSIEANEALTNLDGLGAITSVGRGLTVRGNDALINLDGLSRITSVGGQLFVSDNDALTNLDGLGGISSLRGSVFVEQNSALTSCAALAPMLGWPLAPHDADNDYVDGIVQIRNNAAGAQSPDDCLNAFAPNITVALFNDRQVFLEITDVQQASNPYVVENRPSEPFVSGNIAFTSGTESSLNFGAWPADFEGDNDVELALNEIEDLDIRSEIGPVFALGVDFDDESGGASPSTFTITGLRNGGELFTFEFTTPPSEGRNFIGARSNLSFDTLRIREVQAANENEYFGTVFISSTEVGDTDGDGRFDDRDSCDATPGNEIGRVNAEGCGPSERDTDGDGVNDNLDAFPLDPDEQNDSDGDGFGDNEEINAGSDPNDAGDVPGATGLPVWLLYQASQ
ncbi:MAG: thrombospondin type 3 repeat-containing protein [Pseudomonadota bacterium]